MLGFTWLHKKIRDPETREVYLERWQIGFLNWGSVKLHRIWRKDFGRALHDHPWNFTSLILTGGYQETLLRPGAHGNRIVTKWSHPFQLVRRTLRDRHRINLIRNPCWTLVVCGPRRRTWGFWTDDKTFVPHYEYLNAGTDAQMA